MVGRITEEHLDLAERSFPGISSVYSSMRDKPPTFLHLVWAYEELLSSVAGSDESDRQL